MIEVTFGSNEYFEELKTKLSEVELSTLEESRKFIEKEMVKAKTLGQKNLMHKSTLL